MKSRTLQMTLLLVAAARVAEAQALQGINLFEQHCSSCHASPEPGSRTPNRQTLSERTPEAILDAITTGSMAANAAAMTPAQKRMLAEHLTLRPIGSAAAGAAASMKNQCPAKPFTIAQGSPMWNGWGVDGSN